jgi:hypothetical protein
MATFERDDRMSSAVEEFTEALSALAELNPVLAMGSSTISQSAGGPVSHRVRRRPQFATHRSDTVSDATLTLVGGVNRSPSEPA